MVFGRCYSNGTLTSCHDPRIETINRIKVSPVILKTLSSGYLCSTLPAGSVETKDIRIYVKYKNVSFGL